MKTKMFKKLLATVLALATICSCFTVGVYAKTTDGTITIVDPGRLESIGECISGEKLQSANIVQYVWEGAKSGGAYYEVKTGTDTDYSLGLEGGDITTYPILKANLGEDFWTEENKDKYIVVTLSAVDGGFDYLSLVGNYNLEITTMGNVITWQLDGHDGSKFNTTYFVYKPSDVKRVDDHLEGANYSVYHNGVKTDKANGCWIDEFNQYPTEIGLKLGSWNAGAKTIHMNRFGVYVTDDPMSIINDYDLISDQTGATHAWVPDGQTNETETGYLGKAADDVSTHTATAYFNNDESAQYNCEVRQTLQMHNQDENGDGTADWYTGNADKRYLVFGAQMASNQWTYVGLRADLEWFTPGLTMWDYCSANQWNQIYIVYDRYSEEGKDANRGTTYFYVNGNLIYEGQRGGAWDKLAKRMDKISLFASNFHSGNPTDVHWDNVEMYMTDTLPDLTETMPSLAANEAQAISGTGIYEQLSVALDGVTTPAELTFDGDKVRVYKGGNVNDMLDSDEMISAGDTISVDKGHQVRKYTVTSVAVPAPKLLTNVMAYVPCAGNSAVLSWVNPEYTIQNTKVYLDGEEQAVTVNDAPLALNEICFSGLTAGQEYDFRVTTTIGGEAKEYETSIVVTDARDTGIIGVGDLKTNTWMTITADGEAYANTVFEIADDGEGNYVKMTGNMPEARPNVYAGIGQQIPLDNDSSYVLKFMAKGEGANTLKLMVSPDTEANYKFSNTTVFNLTDEWAEYECVVSPTDITEGTQSQVLLLLYNEIGFTGTVCIDDVELYYYDAEEGALVDLGNKFGQSDFEPIPSVMTDPVYSFENNMLNVTVNASNIDALEVIVAVYKGNEFYKFASIGTDDVITDSYQIGVSYEGDWATNQYNAKVMYWESFSSAKPLRSSFAITE